METYERRHAPNGRRPGELETGGVDGHADYSALASRGILCFSMPSLGWAPLLNSGSRPTQPSDHTTLLLSTIAISARCLGPISTWDISKRHHCGRLQYVANTRLPSSSLSHHGSSWRAHIFVFCAFRPVRFRSKLSSFFLHRFSFCGREEDASVRRALAAIAKREAHPRPGTVAIRYGSFGYDKHAHAPANTNRRATRSTTDVLLASAQANEGAWDAPKMPPAAQRGRPSV
ncbi:hypothetical protein Q7P37_006355 [Cladosporium fusiforme]